MSFRIFQRVDWILLTKLWYMPLLAASMGLMLLRLAMVAHLLPVSEFAFYSAGLLVSSSFCMLACFGLQSLLQRELPILIVRRQERAGSVLLIQCVLVAGISAVFGLLLIVAFNGSLAGLTTRGLSISLFHGLSQQLFTVATIDSRSRNLPIRFARQNLERAILMVLAGPLVIMAGGGSTTILVVEATITLILSAWVLSRKFQLDKFAFMTALFVGWRRIFKVHWRSAITLLAVSSLSFVVLNVDRWIAAQWLSASVFGQYAFAWTLFSIAQSIQLIINASVYPELSKKYALNGKRQCFISSMKLSIFIFAIGIVLSIIGFTLSKYIISVLFIKYTQVNLILPIFFVVAIFRISDFWSSYLIITGQESALLKILISVTTFVLLSWLAYLGFDQNNFSLTAIAVLALLITVINYIIVAFVAWRSSLNLDGMGTKCFD